MARRKRRTSRYENTLLRTSRGKRRRFIITLLFTVCVLAMVWMFRSNRETPALALARAREFVAAGQLDNALAVLERAKGESLISHWIDLSRGNIFEQRGELDQAYHYYSRVSESSAARFDALLGRLRIHSLAPVIIPASENPIDRIDMNELRNDLRLLGRKDLEAELVLIQGREAEAAADIPLATERYLAVRRDYPTSEAANAARTALEQLQSSQQGAIVGDSVDVLLSEGTLLLQEGEAGHALEVVQKAQRQLSRNAAKYFETMLVEEKILRRLKRGEEADHLLLVIAADGPEGSGDVALLTIAKNAWNVNDHHRALEFLSKLRERFPKSPVSDEARYVEARIYEEMELFPEAKEAYNKIIESSNDAIQQLRALRRLGWIAYRKGQFDESTKSFERAVMQARATLNSDGTSNATQPKSFSRRTVTLELHHALYWRADSLLQRQRKGHSEDGGSDLSPEILAQWRELKESDPHGYYGLLANAQLTSRSPEAPLREVRTDLTCRQALPADFQSNIATLHEAQLSDLSAREIDWFLLRTDREALQRFQQPAQIRDDSQLRWMFTRASLYGAFAMADSAVNVANGALQIFDDTARGKQSDLPTLACNSELVELAFPTPLRPVFEEAAHAHKIPAALLYGIARTESRFDARARSRVGALGMMQLMPATAKQEGLQEGQDLFEPTVNVPLGAKHLARLDSMYAGRKPYMIAAYNAGVSAVSNWRNRYADMEPTAWIEMIGYPETLSYVKDVLLATEIYKNRLAAKERSTP